MVTKVIIGLKSVSRLKILPETGPWSNKTDTAIKLSTHKAFCNSDEFSWTEFIRVYGQIVYH